jgi:hypothetical protein
MTEQYFNPDFGVPVGEIYQGEPITPTRKEHTNIFTEGEFDRMGNVITSSSEGTQQAVVNSALDATTEKSAPKETKLVKQTRLNESISFPNGVNVSGSTNNGPYMVIKAYEYTRKLKTKENAKPVYTISLPLPPIISQSYSAQMGNFSGSFVMDSADNIAQAFTSLGGASTAALAGFAGVATTMLGAFAKNRMASAMGDSNGGMAAQQAMWATEKGQPLRSQIETTAGAIINPRYETTFDGMGLRKHQFRFTLVPVSKQEQEDVKAIVNQLRFSMHPSESISDLVLSYPDKFIIEFRDANGKMIEAIRYIPDCMLADFDIDTTVGRMHGNDPVMTTISMAFVEQHTHTRKSDVIA